MLKATKFHLERKIAIEAVRKASKVCLQVFNSLAQGETVVKDDKSPVTVADYSAQAVINTILSEKFPNDPIVGEEDADFSTHPRRKISDIPKTNEQILDAIDKGNYQGGSKGRFWTLDPIDGTKGFLRGGQFAVCLALIVNGSVELGVLGCPNLLLKEADLQKRSNFCSRAWKWCLSATAK
ncbi:3'(2'),5'-bisphosphate nucleotidase [Entomophthora muscae]|uniref:3'(2'),5'-bisphosphate nucleotidase n=1 Tax=Entomophthora muscae TaxID=34485 RepID=A0ACC2SQ83_9FUNG|nr:3'(2'),5'-bisphosphate nucleotidase [Entomophthora muscae]